MLAAISSCLSRGRVEAERVLVFVLIWVLVASGAAATNTSQTQCCPPARRDLRIANDKEALQVPFGYTDLDLLYQNPPHSMRIVTGSP